MNDFYLDTPQKRLEYFLNEKNMRFSEFARAVGLSISAKAQYVGSGKNAKSIIRDEKIINKFADIGLDYYWYLTGKTGIEQNAMIIEVDNIDEKTIKVPIIDKLEDLPYKDLMLMREKMSAYLDKINEMFNDKKD